MWEKGSLTQVNHPCNIFFNPDIKSKRKSYSQSNKTFSEFEKFIMNSNIQKSVLRIFAFPLWMIKRWQGYDELHDFNWSSKGLLYSWLWSTIFKNFMLLVSRDILFISSSFISFFAVNRIRILRFIPWFHFGVTLVFIICQWHVKSCQVSSLSLSRWFMSFLST